MSPVVRGTMVYADTLNSVESYRETVEIGPFASISSARRYANKVLGRAAAYAARHPNSWAGDSNPALLETEVSRVRIEGAQTLTRVLGEPWSDEIGSVGTSQAQPRGTRSSAFIVTWLSIGAGVVCVAGALWHVLG